MRLFLRSYGDSERVTVSPGRMRMKCLRILPEMWATTSCPLSRRTRKCVLASAAVTLPWTSIASSLAMRDAPSWRKNDAGGHAHRWGPHRPAGGGVLEEDV